MFNQGACIDDTPGWTGEPACLDQAEMQVIREALGAIAIAEPAVYWLYRGADEHWRLRRDGETESHPYPDREQAVQALRLAVIRCAACCLYLQAEDGSYVRESFNWTVDDEASDDEEPKRR